jgi:hypothetical protein
MDADGEAVAGLAKVVKVADDKPDDILSDAKNTDDEAIDALATARRLYVGAVGNWACLAGDGGMSAGGFYVATASARAEVISTTRQVIYSVP